VLQPSSYGRAGRIEWLWEIVQQRVRERPADSYTVKLLDQGTDRVVRKIGEEAAEVIIAAKNRSGEELAAEMADLWFHSLLVLQDVGISPDDVFSALAARHRPRDKE
jgi:phosphoribosyl-ATP pyrophosphohydrolase/phosphoribosyl-AMP cyclohydrolase